MDALLEKLTKEELIIVIGYMHDTIQEWNNGWGIPNDVAEKLITIGDACTSFWIQNEAMSISDIKTDH